ncbi:hypothetical protein, partial [Actinobacillus pleuropneumoniae]|uniref:hypothetical protein n=1 Tax=Actinobacillus pleuropneumoniae TaxID=715 RepID=UPI00227BBAE2
MLKAHLKPWLDEAYFIKTTIQGKMAILQKTQQKIKSDNTGPATEQLVEEMKQVATQCTTKVAIVQE